MEKTTYTVFQEIKCNFYNYLATTLVKEKSDEANTKNTVLLNVRCFIISKNFKMPKTNSIMNKR